MRKEKKVKRLKSLMAVILVGVMFMTMTPMTAFAEGKETVGGGQAQQSVQVGQYKLSEDGDVAEPTRSTEEIEIDCGKMAGIIKLPAGTTTFYLYVGEDADVNVEDCDECVKINADGWACIDFDSFKENGSYENVTEYEENYSLCPDGWNLNLDNLATRYYVQILSESTDLFLIEVGGKDEPRNCYIGFDEDNTPKFYGENGYSSDTPVELELYMGVNDQRAEDNRQDIYYTTNGTDPGIGEDGEINGTKYESSITLKTNTVLKARTRLEIGSVVKWGQVLEKTFYIHPEKPTVSWEGAFEQAKSVTLSCDTQGSKIYYTLDGAEPNEDSKEYGSPILIDKALTLKAIAYKGEMSPSETLEVKYYPAELSLDISGSVAKWSSYPPVAIAKGESKSLTVPYGTKSVTIKVKNNVENSQLYLNQGPFTEDGSGNIVEDKEKREKLTADADGTYELELVSGNETNLTTATEKFEGARSEGAHV